MTKIWKRKTTVLSCLMILTGSLYASAECQNSIRAMNAIKHSLLSKDPSNEAQREKGADLQDKGQEYILEFLRMPKGDSCREDFFAAFVVMAATASPFDMESQGAQVISKALMSDSSLLSSYNSALQNFKVEQADAPVNRCRADLLENVVKEMVCEKKHPNSQHCISTFKYERCASLPDPSAE